jgi:hypothetical protein
MKSSFAQPNSFLAISSQLFCQLPNPGTLSIVCCNFHLFSLISAELNSRLTALLELRNSADLNDLLCRFYNPSARDRIENAALLLHEFVCAETCLRSRSIATAVRVTSRSVTIPLLLHADITQQRLFPWLHSSCKYATVFWRTPY